MHVVKKVFLNSAISLFGFIKFYVIVVCAISCFITFFLPSCNKELAVKRRAYKYEGRIQNVSKNIYTHLKVKGNYFPSDYDSLGLSKADQNFLKRKLKCPFFEVTFQSESVNESDSMIIFQPKSFFNVSGHHVMIDMRQIPRDSVHFDGMLRSYEKISKNIHYYRLYLIPMM